MYLQASLSIGKTRFVEKEMKMKILEGLQDIKYKMLGILRISTFALQLLYECEDCGGVGVPQNI